VNGEARSGAANLTKIEHIVVLMLENRSFDHMLGYLSHEDEGKRTDVNGLKREFVSRYPNSEGGQPHPIHHLEQTKFTPPEDPDHSAAATDEQIAGGTMNGFASSFAKKIAGKVAGGDPGLVMGYYNAADLPVYDHLAANFCVCDRWHSSVPGATWPNRLYALCGQADGSRDDRPHPEPPLYKKPSFVRHLDAHGISWRWYSYDPATLRCADAHYMVDPKYHDNFAYVSKTKLSWKTELEEEVLIDESSASFLEDAAKGMLPQVAWIDPNFNDINIYGADSNDDHPPSDVKGGQDLVLLVYNALAASPLWNKLLFIVTYDEHGGFFDHEPPPPAADDDEKKFGRYGLRVPALVISPYVESRSVAKVNGESILFDHTSIILTILLKFCGGDLGRKKPPRRLFRWLDFGHPHYMGKRTASANDLGLLLTRSEAREPPARDALIAAAAERAAAAAKAKVAQPVDTGADHQPLTDLQRRLANAARVIRAKGLPPGQP
jgi:phospholipase C